MGYASAPIFVSPFPPPHPPRTPTDRDARRLEANLDSTALHPQYIHTWRPSLRVSLPLPTQTLLVQIFDGREAYKSENSPNTSATPLPLDSQASRFFDFPITPSFILMDEKPTSLRTLPIRLPLCHRRVLRLLGFSVLPPLTSTTPSQISSQRFSVSDRTHSSSQRDASKGAASGKKRVHPSEMKESGLTASGLRSRQ